MYHSALVFFLRLDLFFLDFLRVFYSSSSSSSSPNGVSAIYSYYSVLAGSKNFWKLVINYKLIDVIKIKTNSITICCLIIGLNLVQPLPTYE